MNSQADMLKIQLKSINAKGRAIVLIIHSWVYFLTYKASNHLESVMLSHSEFIAFQKLGREKN